MSDIKDGGPAFPIAAEPGIMAGANGMSLRDYFAAQALVGMMAGRKGLWPMEIAAKESYEIADFMIVERSK